MCGWRTVLVDNNRQNDKRCSFCRWAALTNVVKEELFVVRFETAIVDLVRG